MVIGPIRAPLPVAGNSVARPSSEGGFSVPVPADGRAQPAPVGMAGTMTPVGSTVMLALQEQAARGTSDREARRHGRAMIEQLVALQRALLSGAAAEMVDPLSSIARIDLQGVDPALAQILASIRLRARVELERLSRET